MNLIASSTSVALPQHMNLMILMSWRHLLTQSGCEVSGVSCHMFWKELMPSVHWALSACVEPTNGADVLTREKNSMQQRALHRKHPCSPYARYLTGQMFAQLVLQKSVQKIAKQNSRTHIFWVSFTHFLGVFHETSIFAEYALKLAFVCPYCKRLNIIYVPVLPPPPPKKETRCLLSQYFVQRAHGNGDAGHLGAG